MGNPRGFRAGTAGRLEELIASLDERMPLFWFRVVIRHTYDVLLADVSPILTDPADFGRAAFPIR